jgi:hypothetical protein
VKCTATTFLPLPIAGGLHQGDDVDPLRARQLWYVIEAEEAQAAEQREEHHELAEADAAAPHHRLASFPSF